MKRTPGSRSADQLTRELRSGGLGGVIVANISVAVAGEEEDVPEEEPEVHTHRGYVVEPTL